MAKQKKFVQNNNNLAIAYYRYSSHAQNEASIEQQREEVKRYAKDERYRASVRWTLATASDQAPAGARVESLQVHQNKKHCFGSAFFNEIRPYGRVKSTCGG